MGAMRVLLLLAALCVVVTVSTSTERPPIVGGFSDVEDVNSAQVTSVINVGTGHLAGQPDFPCRDAYSVQRVQKQVVSGIKYRITYRANTTACGITGERELNCTVDVVVQAWRNSVTPSRPICEQA